MQTLFISYVGLTPGLENKFADLAHPALIKNLRDDFSGWKNFFANHPGYSLAFIVVTKEDIDKLTVKGPTVFKDKRIVDYSIFLPSKEHNLQQYVDYVFEGIGIAIETYGIKKDILKPIREKCISELGL